MNQNTNTAADGTDTKPAKWLVLAAFAAVYFLWGSTYVGIRMAVETIPPFLMAGCRQFFAGVILYAILRMRGEPVPRLAHVRDAAVVGFMLLLVQNGTLSWVEKSTPSALAALIVAATPFWMILINRITVRGSRFTIPMLLGLVLGFSGVAVIVFSHDHSGKKLVAPLSAALLFGASIFWAAGSQYSRHARTPRHPLMAAALQLMTGGGMLLTLSTCLGEPMSLHTGDVSHRSALALFYLCIMGSLVGFTAYAWLLKVSTIARVSTIAFVNPLVAVILGSTIAHEPMSPAILFAGTLIIGAVILITWKKSDPGASR